MPQLTIGGHEFTFNGVNIYLSLVPFFMIPVTFTIGLICHKKPMLKIVLVIVLFQILFAMSIISNLTIMNRVVQIGPVHLIIMLLCAWAIFVGVLRHISMRCCLVSQGG